MKKRNRQNQISFAHPDYKYKPLAEKDIQDSLLIPNLEWPRDFQRTNHNIEEEDYQFIKSLHERDEKIKANPQQALTPELIAKYTSNFNLKELITTNKSQLNKTTMLVQQDEKVINLQLYGRIKDNIGKFHESFNNLEQLKLDMHDAKTKTIMIKESAQKLKTL